MRANATTNLITADLKGKEWFAMQKKIFFFRRSYLMGKVNTSKNLAVSEKVI